jgi:2-oxoglutarate ferredoxin oxidoreductase subunit alpha
MKAEAAKDRTWDLSVAITGAGGSGAVTAGLILLDAAAKAGLYGLMTRSAGPQIRGGESASLLRLADAPVGCIGDRFGLLLGLDWRNAGRFAQEIPLDAASLILGDPASGPVPEAFLTNGAQGRELALAGVAARVEGGRVNMVAVGVAGAFLGLPRDALAAAVHAVLGDKREGLIEAAVECVGRGFELAADLPACPGPVAADAPVRWNISGNEACGLGALRGGVRFVAAYPITPASDMLEWLSPRLERLGGSLVQAEDELASINMIIGASFGGVPAMTATSGPGLSLMQEGLGLAVASETPVVVIDVTRGGPSTGIPTKAEQSDLNSALYGMHGETPHLVLAPLDVRDCVFTTQWAVRLAERLQTAAIVLSDQSLGQARAVTDPPLAFERALARPTEPAPRQGYRRYAQTADGVSPMALPGSPLGMYTADGLAHDESGMPSSQAEDQLAQLHKRRRKLEDFDYGPDWAVIRGDGELCLIAWGSASAVVFEAAARLSVEGLALRVIALRLLAPLPVAALREALDGVREAWIVEQNESGQLYHYLQAHDALPAISRSFCRAGPVPLRPGEILAAVTRGGRDK